MFGLSAYAGIGVDIDHVKHKTHHVLLADTSKGASLGDGDGLWFRFRLGHDAPVPCGYVDNDGGSAPPGPQQQPLKCADA